MSKTHKSCLVLNADYSPIGIISWQKAMIWLFRYNSLKYRSIEIISYYTDDYIITTTGQQEIPAVIKTTKYFKLNNHTVHFCRKNLFLRDDHTCQYCSTKLIANQLTYDHVIPKSKWDRDKRGPSTSWTNIVTACRRCNIKKGNKTPEQANMPLIKTPFIPKKTSKYLPFHDLSPTITNSIPEPWALYLE
jgi:5-methylcytosine-specific restriction endonuclease McrA